MDAEADSLVRFHACKAMARGYAEESTTEKSRLAHARAFCRRVMNAYWATQCSRHGTGMRMKALALALPSLPEEAGSVADDLGSLIAEFPVEDAGFLVGSVYTVMLPVSLRSELGAYYTPPPLVARLLDRAEAAGFDFATGSVIDPACGGGAFLAPAAQRMIARAGNASPEWMLGILAKRLKGIEIDPFAAWLTSVLLDVTVMPLCVLAKRRLADVVTVGDALQMTRCERFDLVIGNPPYGRAKLDAQTRTRYARSLYGHANLYGLFTDLALQLVKSTGVVAYLTPTSFLGGQYFKALRRLLADEVKASSFDFVVDRFGVFEGVLQETMLATYAPRESASAHASVAALVPQGLNAALVEPVGHVEVPAGGGPWLLPRAREDAVFIETVRGMPTRLNDLGYSVSTGPLVWNRHKDQLKKQPGKDTLPLVWAESVAAGKFELSAARRNHVPYIAVRRNQQHLITRESCVLVQRTTSKEQSRRLVASLLPQDMLDQHGGAVVENHLNMVQAMPLGLTEVSLATIAALLNSAVVDRLFRCISGSVAVSAYELNAIPLPSLVQLRQLESLVEAQAPQIMVERAIALCYGEVRELA